LAREIISLKKYVKGLETRLPGLILPKISQMLDEKGIAAGNVTRQAMREMIDDCLKSALDARNIPRAPLPDVEEVVPQDKIVWTTYTWGGKIHVLDEGFILTRKAVKGRPVQKRTPKQAYLRWYLADMANMIPPLRLTNPDDYSIYNQRSRFNDWSRMVKTFNLYLRQCNKPLVHNPNAEQIHQQFADAMQIHYVLVRNFHPSKRKRKRKNKRTNVALSTILTEMRKIQDVLDTIPAKVRKVKAIMQLQSSVRRCLASKNTM
jgi:hypothetical protein